MFTDNGNVPEDDRDYGERQMTLEDFPKELEFLERYEKAMRKELRLDMECQKQRDLIDALNDSLGGDGMPHGSGISNTTEAKALRLADKLLEYEEAKAEAIETRQEVFDLVAKVPGVMGDVLYYRYIDLMKWSEIAGKMNYDERQARNIRLSALKYIQDFLVFPS